MSRAQPTTQRRFARTVRVTVLVASALAPRLARCEDATFNGAPLSIVLEPGRLTELVFPREVLDVVSGDEIHVATQPGDAVVYVRPARPAFETSFFVRVAGGYSVPIEVRESTDGHPTVSLRVAFAKNVRALEGLARAEPESSTHAAATSAADGALASPLALMRAMVLGEPLPGYSIVDGGRAAELERPDLGVRRLETWVSPTWDGVIVEVENQTDAPLALDPMSFQGVGPTAPRYVYIESPVLAPRPTLASATVIGAHRTRVMIVRPAARPAGAGRIPRKPLADTTHSPASSASPRVAAPGGTTAPRTAIATPRTDASAPVPSAPRAAVPSPEMRP